MGCHLRRKVFEFAVSDGRRQALQNHTAEPTSKPTVAVRSYRSVLKAYVNNAESKFNGPDRKQCCAWTRGVLQRTHIVAGEYLYCGKEFKRKLEQGALDHEVEFKCKVYENGRVVAGPETLGQLSSLPERQISKRTGVHRDTIRLIRHGRPVKRSTSDAGALAFPTRFCLRYSRIQAALCAGSR